MLVIRKRGGKIFLLISKFFQVILDKNFEIYEKVILVIFAKLLLRNVWPWKAAETDPWGQGLLDLVTLSDWGPKKSINL